MGYYPFGNDLFVSEFEVLFNELEHLLGVFLAELLFHFNKDFAFGSHLKAFILFLLFGLLIFILIFVFFSVLSSMFLSFFFSLLINSSLLFSLFRSHFHSFGVFFLSELFSLKFELFQGLLVEVD